MLVHIVCCLFTGFVIYIAKPGTSLFSWHPALMVIAFTWLMVQSIMALAPGGSVFGGMSRGAKFQVHRGGMLAALMCALTGCTTIWLNKERAGRAHYTSWHGLLGAITVCYTLVQCFAGMLVRYPGLIPRSLRPPSLRMYHATSGLALTGLACVTVALGLGTTWFMTRVSGPVWYACLAVPAVLAITVLKQINASYSRPVTR